MAPGWLTHHLAQRTAAGIIATVDLDQLAGLVDDISAWRIEYQLVDTTPEDQPLGPILDNVIDCTRQRTLACRLTTRPRQPEGSRSIA